MRRNPLYQIRPSFQPRRRAFAGHPAASRPHRGLLHSALLLTALLLLALAANIAAAQAQGDYKVWLPLALRAAASTPIHTGIATYYNADGNGACLFGPSPADLNVAAMNGVEYNHSAYCGAYVFVQGPKGQVTVRITDLCPECQAGHLDLSRQAFAQIADPALGRVSITWQVVSPELSGPIAYHFKDGSNQWWTAVQVRNHRNPVAKLEYQRAGAWIEAARSDWNYFVEPSGMGPGPYTFRVTDAYGNVLVDTGIPHVENGTVSGAAQFPPGP